MPAKVLHPDKPKTAIKATTTGSIFIITPFFVINEQNPSVLGLRWVASIPALRDPDTATRHRDSVRTRPLDGLEKLLGNDVVGIDIGAIERRHQTVAESKISSLAS